MKEISKDTSHADKVFAEHMGQVESLILDLVRGPGPLQKIVSGHFATGGKRLRARLALRSLEALGAMPRIGLAWAAACELLHNATLIHDDLQDGDTFRRGKKTVWAEHGIPQAVNAGDLLLILPYRAIDRIPMDTRVKWELSKCMATYSEQTVRGQSREFELRNEMDSPQLMEEYSLVTSGKTSSLFELPVYGSGIMLGLTVQRCNQIASEFSRIGLMFQMVDDLLDFFGKKGRLTAGEDLREGKVTVLVARFLQMKCSGSEDLKAFLLRDRSSVSAEEIKEWLWKMEESGVVKWAVDKAFSMNEEFCQSPIVRELPALHREGVVLCEKILAPLREAVGEVSLAN